MLVNYLTEGHNTRINLTLELELAGYKYNGMGGNPFFHLPHLALHHTNTYVGESELGSEGQLPEVASKEHEVKGFAQQPT